MLEQLPTTLKLVMPGLDPGIQMSGRAPENWIAGSSPAMTPSRADRSGRKLR
jgi:hypothetical protein